MFLLILDKNPYKAAELVPDRLKFKQLLELCQLICSADISNVYKQIKQGKKLQKWIKDNKLWVYRFMTFLWFWAAGHLQLKPKTLCDLYKIRDDLLANIQNKKRIVYPKIAIFRYVKEYSEFTKYQTNSELPINVAVEEYKKYIEWKEKRR